MSQRGFKRERRCHVNVQTPERRLSSHLKAAESQPAPDHCGAEPISKCLHLVPPTFMVALGVVRIRTHWKLPGHLTLYFLGSTCLNSLHQSSRLCSVSLLRAEAKGDRQRRAGALTTAQGEERRATAPAPLMCQVSCQSMPPVRQALTWTSQSWGGGGGSKLMLSILTLLEKTSWFSLSEDWDGEGGGRGVRDGEHMHTHGWFMSMYGKNHYNIVK